MIDYKILAYWLNVVQTDGFLYKKRDKNRRKLYVEVTVGKKSLPMLNKFTQFSNDLFGLHPKIFHDKNRGMYMFRIGVTKLQKFLEDNSLYFLDPPEPPDWIFKNETYFGAYLAGVIDGDGNVRIKRKSYPQCIIRITSGKPQNVLRDHIVRNLGCKASICKRSRISFLNGRKISGTWFDLEFYVSKKNIKFIRLFIIPHITIDHKRNNLQKFIEKRYDAPAGIRNPASF